MKRRCIIFIIKLKGIIIAIIIGINGQVICSRTSGDNFSCLSIYLRYLIIVVIMTSPFLGVERGAVD